MTEKSLVLTVAVSDSPWEAVELLEQRNILMVDYKEEDFVFFLDRDGFVDFFSSTSYNEIIRVIVMPERLNMSSKDITKEVMYCLSVEENEYPLKEIFLFNFSSVTKGFKKVKTAMKSVSDRELVQLSIWDNPVTEVIESEEDTTVTEPKKEEEAVTEEDTTVTEPKKEEEAVTEVSESEEDTNVLEPKKEDSELVILAKQTISNSIIVKHIGGIEGAIDDSKYTPDMFITKVSEITKSIIGNKVNGLSYLIDTLVDIFTKTITGDPGVEMGAKITALEAVSSYETKGKNKSLTMIHRGPYEVNELVLHTVILRSLFSMDIKDVILTETQFKNNAFIVDEEYKHYVSAVSQFAKFSNGMYSPSTRDEIIVNVLCLSAKYKLKQLTGSNYSLTLFNFLIDESKYERQGATK